MDWVGFASGFVSGALAGVIGAIATVYFAGRLESGRDLAQRRHRIYLLLLELYNKHFWISTNDMHHTEIKREHKQEFQELKYKILDELRGADRLEQLRDIVDVLLSKAELKAMADTGFVQPSRSGATYVAVPPNAQTFAARAASGSVYVEFDVPVARVQVLGNGVGRIIGPAANDLYNLLRTRRGLEPFLSPAPAFNISDVLAIRL